MWRASLASVAKTRRDTTPGLVSGGHLKMIGLVQSYEVCPRANKLLEKESETL